MPERFSLRYKLFTDYVISLYNNMALWRVQKIFNLEILIGLKANSRSQNLTQYVVNAEENWVGDLDIKWV